MKVVVHDRTEALPAPVRAVAERKLTRLSRHFDRVLDAEVEVVKEAGRNSPAPWAVEITVHMDGRKHPLVKAREAGADARAALDRALDKIDRQVVRLKEKIKIERKRPHAVKAELADALGRPRGEAAGMNGREWHAAPERIRLKLRPESLSDAEAALDAGEQPFYVFLDESSGDVNVCFRRPDGGLAVIEAVVT